MNTQLTRFLQTPFWAAFKENHGWKSHFFEYDSVNVSVLVRSISRFAGIAYVPMALENQNPKQKDTIEDYFLQLKDFSKKIKNTLPKNCLCLRFDPPIENPSQNRFLPKILKQNGFVKPKTDIQPPDTVLLDLSLTQEQLLQNMKPKWRYNIKLAQKKDVQIRVTHIDSAAFKTDINIFYSLYKETAARDGIQIHTKSYYEDLFLTGKNCAKQDKIQIRLYIAEHQKEPIAAIIVLFSPFETVYLYGASSNEKRNLMPAYFLQWQAINDAKLYNSLYYDFYGIPPSDNQNHPMHGLYRFKTGFGGQIIHRIGSIDFPLSPLYYAYTFLENLRSFWFKKIKKIFLKKNK